MPAPVPVRSRRARSVAGALFASLVAAGALAACAEEPAPPARSTTVAASTGALRYCLAPDLGEARPIVERLLADLTTDALPLVHVKELDDACAFGLDGIDFAVSDWGDRACRDTLDEAACMVRSLLVDTEDLGESTADSSDPEVVENLGDQLAFMIELGLGGDGAPAITQPPVTVDPALTGCGGVTIGPVVPAAPTNYQAITFSGQASVDPSCSAPTYTWTSSNLFFPFGTGTAAQLQLPVGTYQITFTVSVSCPDPNDASAPWITYVCADDVSVTVVQGTLMGGPFCDHDLTWWIAQDAAGLAHIQDERTTTITTITGTNVPDLLLGNKYTNKINGRRHGDCLYGFDERDLIDGHAGGDIIFGGDGNDTLYGQDDQDHIYGEQLGDRIRGGNGGDYLDAGDGDDDVNGNFDRDTILGSFGNDHLVGGWGDDTIYGGSGNDCVRGDLGADTLYGDDDDDIVAGELGNDRMYGGLGADQMDGGWDADDIYGGAGDDTMFGDLGGDDLFGEDGDDTLCGGAGSDNKDGGYQDNDTCQLGGSNTDCENVPWVCPFMTIPSC